MLRLALVAGSFAAALAVGNLPNTGLPDGFVAVKGTQLTVGDDCHPFYFSGWNSWEFLELASEAPSPPFRSTPLKGKQHVLNVMDTGVKAGLKVIRLWAHSMTPGWELQTGPTTYNEKVLVGMDFVMDEAAKRGLRIIWVLADNWYPLGIDQQVKLGGASRHQDFYTSAAVKAGYKRHIAFLLSRTNTLNGKVYGQDPTVMAWNLANEARCQGCPSSAMQSWVSEMCAAVKAAAPRHLVSIGYEGFFGPASSKLSENPGLGGSDWASREGQDFTQNNLDPCVDFVGIHAWPDNWAMRGPKDLTNYIESRLRETAAVIKKPFILEEYGKITNGDTTHKLRNSYFAAAMAAAEANAKAGGPLMGSLFWHLYDAGMGPGQYGVHATDSTWSLITQHTGVMNGLYASAAPTCAAA